jgi:hypothetical protein
VAENFIIGISLAFFLWTLIGAVKHVPTPARTASWLIIVASWGWLQRKYGKVDGLPPRRSRRHNRTGVRP